MQNVETFYTCDIITCLYSLDTFRRNCIEQNPATVLAICMNLGDTGTLSPCDCSTNYYAKHI